MVAAVDTRRAPGSDMSLSRYASSGAIRFLFRYVWRRILSHSIVLAAVFGAVSCAVASQWAVKTLVDVLGSQNPPPYRLWGAVGMKLSFPAA